MYTFTGLPAISSQNLTLWPSSVSQRDLAREAYLGSLVLDAKRQSAPLASRRPTRRTSRFIALLTAR